MSTKRKESRFNTWRTERRRYTWHLRPPFKNEFDRAHWWKRESKVEPVAALYELARRHPLVGDEWTRTTPQQDFPALSWTCLLGRKSWAKLSSTDRMNWESCVGKLKGLDFRDDSLQYRSVKLLAHWRIIDQREDAQRKEGQTFDELRAAVHRNIAENPITADEWETAIAQLAVEAHRRGRVLLAVAPDIAANTAASVIGKKYCEHLKLYPPEQSQQRGRWQDWLPIIAEFEDAETSSDKAKSQVFARYRRALDGIRFA